MRPFKWWITSQWRRNVGRQGADREGTLLFCIVSFSGCICVLIAWWIRWWCSGSHFQYASGKDSFSCLLKTVIRKYGHIWGYTVYLIGPLCASQCKECRFVKKRVWKHSLGMCFKPKWTVYTDVCGLHLPSHIASISPWFWRFLYKSHELCRCLISRRPD